MEPESFRGGGGGEAIGGRTGGPAYTETDPAPLGFVGSSEPEGTPVIDRSGLVSLFMEVFKFLLLATVVTILGVFVLGFVKGRTVNAGLNALKNIFAK